MLKTVNFAVFKCLECGNTIKVQPGRPVAKVECDCETKVEAKPKSKKDKTPPVKTVQAKSGSDK